MYNANDKTLYNGSSCLLTESELSKLDPRLVHVLAYQRLQQLITQTTSKVRLFCGETVVVHYAVSSVRGKVVVSLLNTARNATDLMQVVDFTGLMQFANKLYQAC